jgi:hypothetical protein
MARAERFTNHLLSQSASKDNPQRVRFDGKKVTGITITNSTLSAQTLWVGVNDDSCIEPLEPGQSKPIAARDDAYLDGYIAVAWDDTTTAPNERTGIYTIGVDSGEIKDC